MVNDEATEVVEIKTNEVVDKKLETENEIFSQCDICVWPDSIKNVDNYIIYWIKSGSSKLHDCDANLLKKNSYKQEDSSSRRICQESMFERKHKNGEIIRRVKLS